MKTIQVENLKCGGCANTIKKALLSFEGINAVEINVDSSEVIIDTDNEQLLSDVKKKLSSLGYPEIGENNTVLKKAKSYVSCAVGRI
ncbi:heavy-metal-associated domain-containing protein [Urechidicola croceus]|uniref:Heavy metal transporter n=1 Tax=Urechidicola croceus TaxID=1850246 RepID=A0A1D8PAA4_9FLAO|nr:heavy metal-associated domain-containing protein [Urechidicola croceus]AOW21495.1 heavy metal transporter [Urechidicola croceus]